MIVKLNIEMRQKMYRMSEGRCITLLHLPFRNIFPSSLPIHNNVLPYKHIAEGDSLDNSASTCKFNNAESTTENE